jgi:hypothetical protein
MGRKKINKKVVGNTLFQIPQPYLPCFIASAVYDSSSYYKIDYLREFRDEFLNKTRLGNKLVRLYYRLSPPIAEFIKKKEILKFILRYSFIEPCCFLSKFLTSIKRIIR